MIILQNGNPATPKQEKLIDQLISHDLTADPSYYTGMDVPSLIEAMEEAYRRIALLKSTELGRALV
jgi:hypothetical protein